MEPQCYRDAVALNVYTIVMRHCTIVVRHVRADSVDPIAAMYSHAPRDY
jgi:hypothetical protein